jgi:hypothetical protein
MAPYSISYPACCQSGSPRWGWSWLEHGQPTSQRSRKKSRNGLAIVSERSRKAASTRGFVSPTLVLNFPWRVGSKCGCRGVCRGFTRVVSETVERLFSQDGGYRMATTKTPDTRKAATSSKQGND